MSGDASFTPELILRAHHSGRWIVEVPVDYHPRLTGEAKSFNFRNVRATLLDMAKLWLELRLRFRRWGRPGSDELETPPETDPGSNSS